MTLHRLARLSATLNRDEALKRRYVTEMENLIFKGYAEDTSQTKGSPGKAWYLTQHPWRHIRSEDNPADDATRGLSAREFLVGGRWLNGPSFLCLAKCS
ncbi:hypothetical protein O3P69_016952 [Scylla paramamosain]|uniref:Uncharacterized protein n=1 Tax=Scylla paramamosain TaxID=85552 RepID=A0AAW0TT32_SCYPA